MKTVWEFTLQPMDEQEINMPAFATMLTAQMQHNAIQVWAVVDPDQSVELQKFYIVGTGGSIPDDATYLATFQMNHGEFVFHVFYVNNVYVLREND